MTAAELMTLRTVARVLRTIAEGGPYVAADLETFADDVEAIQRRHNPGEGATRDERENKGETK